MKLQVHKVYSYEPGKTLPLPPIPPTPTTEAHKDEDLSTQKDKYEAVDNLNEFNSSPSQEKRSSQNILEKKLVKDVLDIEEKNPESDVKQGGGSQG